MATKPQDMDDVPTGGGDKGKKPTDLVEALELRNKKYVELRPVGPIYTYAGHWIRTTDKDGKKVAFYTPCAAWDSEAGKRKGNYGMQHCAWCNHEQHDHDRGVEKTARMSRFATDHWMNVISRAVQKKGMGDDQNEEPTKGELKSGFKSKESDTYTPYRAWRLSPSLLGQIKDLKQLNNQPNKDGDLQSFPVNHPLYGADIMVMKDEDKPPAQYYSVQYSKPSKLTKVEKAQLQWDLSDMTDYPDTEHTVNDYKNTMKRLGKKPYPFGADADSDEEDDLPKAKKKGRAVEDDDDDEDDLPKAKAKAKSKAKPVDDDEDDEDDTPPPKKSSKKSAAFDDSDEDDDDEPPVKSKKPVKKSKPVDDDEDEDDDDEDEVPPKKAKKPAPKKSKPADDEDEDDEDEDDDEDDAPPKKSSKKPPVKKSKHVDEDDEDEDEEDEDEDEDEDDVPPPKKSSKKPAATKGKAKPVEDEDDDEDRDDEPPAKAKKPVKKSKPVDDDEDEDDL